jgi:hypothetical protein
MFIPDVLNTLLMGLIFMVIVVTVVRPIMLNMLTGKVDAQDVQRAALESVQAHVQRATQEAATQRTGRIRYQQLLLALPERRQPLALPAPPVAAQEGDGASADGSISGEGAAAGSADGTAVSSDGAGQTANTGQIELAEGESLHDLKERIKLEKKNAAKPVIPAELLNGAKSYEDKVGVVRMVVQQDNTRVAGVIRGMIETK